MHLRIARQLARLPITLLIPFSARIMWRSEYNYIACPYLALNKSTLGINDSARAIRHKFIAYFLMQPSAV